MHKTVYGSMFYCFQNTVCYQLCQVSKSRMLVAKLREIYLFRLLNRSRKQISLFVLVL